MWDNASPFEVGGLLLGLVALVFAALNMLDAFADWIWLAQSHSDGVRKWAARRHLRQSAGNLGIVLAFCVMGGVLMTLPGTSTEGPSVPTPASAVIWGTVAFVLVVISIMCIAEFIERRTYNMLIPADAVPAEEATTDATHPG